MSLPRVFIRTLDGWRGIAILPILAICTVSLLLTVGSIVFTVGQPIRDRDFLAYWTAGQQAAHHANPYDAKAVLALERSAGSNGMAVVMRNPPPAIMLVLPLGILPWRQASLLWTGMLLASFLASVQLLWTMLGKPSSSVLLLGCTFGPALLCLCVGQTSLFMLLGVVLFLRFQSSQPFLAGASLWLCLLKPHLLLPFGVVVLACSLYTRRYSLLAGSGVAMISSTMIALYLDPGAWSHYATMMTTSGIDQEPIPSLGVALRFALSPSLVWLQFVPAVAACLWAGFYFSRHRDDWDWMQHGSVLLPVSLLVSPYAWSTDQAIVLPAILFVVASTESREFMVAVALGSASMELAPLFGYGAHSHFYVLMALFWCSLSLLANRLHRAMRVNDPPPPAEGAAMMIENA